MRRFTVEERRARLALRHRLPHRAATVQEVAEDVVGLHSSDPATVYLAAEARIAGFTVDQLDEALYETRELVRMLGMRRTLFVVSRHLAAVMNAACTQALHAPELRRTIKLLDGHVDDPAGWLRRVSASTVEALARLGPSSAAELTKEVPDLELKIPYGEDTRWAGQMGMSTRVLFLLATEAMIVRARPRGTWRSGQYRWALVDDWLGGSLEDIPVDEARVELLRRWLARHGPATSTDVTWWTGWGKRVTARALDEVAAVEVEIDGGEVGWVLADDLDPVEHPPPWVALLPSLDPVAMGWKERDWYLGEHRHRLFDRNGNAGPTVWCNGRVVGGWSQLDDGEVVFRLLDDVGSEAAEAVEAEAAALQTWLGEHRVIPRFRTPLDKELAGRPGPPAG